MRIIVYLLTIVHMSLQDEQCLNIGDVRLNGSRYAGLVEVCYFYSWRTVCGDDWSNTSAGVICRQLNYTDLSHQGL